MYSHPNIFYTFINYIGWEIDGWTEIENILTHDNNNKKKTNHGNIKIRIEDIVYYSKFSPLDHS